MRSITDGSTPGQLGLFLLAVENGAHRHQATRAMQGGNMDKIGE